VTRRRRRPPKVASLLIALALLIAGPVAWYLLRPPKLVFTNALAAPVWLAVGQGAPVMIAPGATHKASLKRSGSLVLQWNLARPLSADQRPMGEEMRGSAVVREPSRTVRLQATTGGASGEYFAPLITNATDRLLRIVVNAGLDAAVDCGCAVRPGARRVFVGYYRLYRNSTVRASDDSGQSATFRDLGPSVTSRDGRVGLRFEAKDFR
jgi:hypothetical protein